MDLGELIAWRTTVEDAVGSVMAGFADRYGYPPGRNVVEDPDAVNAARLSAIGTAIPEDLSQFYATVGAVSLPDVGNGLFVHDAGLVADTYNVQKLRHVTGRHHAEVVVFASDGGGTQFALASPAGSPVYRLPPDEVVAGVYESDSPRFDVVTTDLAGFLARLLHYVERFAVTGEVVDL
jgi:hypothetical protein